MMDEKNIYQNRAVPIKDITGAVIKADTAGCETCDEVCVFAMRDKYHEFSLGLSTIIQCLAMAEREGAVPPLPEEWWWRVHP